MAENKSIQEDPFGALKLKFIDLFSKLNFKSDITLWTLILVNVITLVTAIIEEQSLAYVLLVAWGQSVILGVFAARRISQVKQYAIEPATARSKEYDPNKSKQTSAVLFFVFYSFFHLIYLVFILAFHWLGDMAFPSILEYAVMFLVFFLHHWYVFMKRNKYEEGVTELPTLSKLIREPMLRMLPIHFVVMVGVFFLILDVSGIVTVIVFQLVKLFFDILFHTYKHL